MASTPYSQLNPLLDALLACAARSPAEMRQATVLPSTVDRHTLPSPSIPHPSWQESYRG